MTGVQCAQACHAAALNDYFHAFKQARQEPLPLLCMGVALLNQVMTKKVLDRNRAVLQVFAFLQVRHSSTILLFHM